MGVALAVALGAFVSAHAAILAGLVRRRLWAMAVAAAVLWPLAPWEGWRLGMRARALTWVGSLVAYALGVAASVALTGGPPMPT